MPRTKLPTANSEMIFYRSHFVRFPDQGISVVVLANTPINTSGLAFRVAELYLADAIAAPEEETKTDKDEEAERRFIEVAREVARRRAVPYRDETTGEIWTVTNTNNGFRFGAPALNILMKPVAESIYEPINPAADARAEFKESSGDAPIGLGVTIKGKRQSPSVMS